MQEKKKVIIQWVAVLTVALVLYGCVLGFKGYEYRVAMDSVENFRYELAEQQFLNMNGYKDSEEMAAKMAELTKKTKSEVQKLFPILDFNSEHRYWYTYLCVEKGIGLQIEWDWKVGGWPDHYARWGANILVSEDISAVNHFFFFFLIDGQNESVVYLLQFHQETGEYIFLRCIADDNVSANEFVPSEVWYRAKLNEDGSLEVYNNEGEYYVFLPYSYHDHTTDKQKVVNPDLK